MTSFSDHGHFHRFQNLPRQKPGQNQMQSGHHRPWILMFKSKTITFMVCENNLPYLECQRRII